MLFELPKLDFSYQDLEPYIDATTMEIHYSKHHQAYVTNLNKTLANNPEISEKSLESLLRNLNGAPEAIRTAVKNNGGGHYNHSFFWKLLEKPAEYKPSGTVFDAINKTFGDFETFKKVFGDAALARFGSGWVWLIINKAGELEVASTPNQDSPVMDGNKPLLGLDVWEHAYYLKYQNKRADYVAAWWNLINWKQIDQNHSSLFTI